jgi:hypothetical protein
MVIKHKYLYFLNYCNLHKSLNYHIFAHVKRLETNLYCYLNLIVKINQTKIMFKTI